MNTNTELHLSYSKIFLICLNISLSSLFIGYALVYVSAIGKFKTIIGIYNVHIGSESDTESFIQGIVPIGGIIGGLGGRPIIKLFSRK